MTLLDSDNYQLPEPAPGDRAYAALRTVVSSVPVLGKAGAELLQFIVAPPLERRRLEWMSAVADGLRRLEARGGVDLDALGTNSAFVDAVLTATQAAIRTSQRGKLEALRGAVLNSALPTSLDQTSQQVFLAWVDRFTELHLQILKVFHEPRAWRKHNGQHLEDRRRGDAADVLEEAFPELASERGRALYEQVWLDLHTTGLVRLNTLHNAMEGDGIMKKRTTALGDAFVAFMTSPLLD